jgi:hypothetical protein
VVENVENEGEGEGEKQWLAVETVEAGGELLFIVHLQNSGGECRKRRRRRERGEGEKQWLVVETIEASGEKELLSTDVRRSFFFPLFLLFSFSLSTKIKQMKNIAKKS